MCQMCALVTQESARWMSLLQMEHHVSLALATAMVESVQLSTRSANMDGVSKEYITAFKYWLKEITVGLESKEKPKKLS